MCSSGSKEIRIGLTSSRHLHEIIDASKADSPSTPIVCLSGYSNGFPIADLGSAMHSAFMEHATLAGFLTGTLSPEDLATEIAAEVDACNAAFRAGENGYFIITDGPNVEVTREGARRLLAAIAEEQLSFELANYVADCIIVSDDFDFADAAVRDAIHFVEDDSRPPTREETIEALALLR